jgi:endonuclease G, mitochondrial
MRSILTILTLLLCVSLTAQDVVVLKHKEYTSHFSKSKKYPVMVEWWATRAKVSCPTPLPRKDNFKPDPLLPAETNLGADYLKSGYDRGHVSPAADNLCMTSEIQDECFYFSNMIPQTHTLNAGIWKTLEVHTRTLALEQDSIHVWAGAVGDKGKIGKVTIPTQCWKVIYVKRSREWTAFLFENDKTKPGSLNEVRVTLEDIQKLTSLKFNQ